MQLIFMGKYKLNDWKELDRLDPSPNLDEEKAFTEDMWKEENGRGWAYKWEQE